MERVKRNLVKLYNIIKRPEMEILPGHLAFFLVLSLVPILTLVAIVASQFSLSVDVLVNFISNSLPREIANMITPFVVGRGFDFNVGMFMIASFLIASNGLYSVILSANTLYKSEDNNVLKRRIKSVVLMIIMVFLFVFVILVIAFGKNIILLISEYIKNESFMRIIFYIYLIIKWPLGFTIILFTINLIYTIAPNIKLKSRYSLKGSLFTTISWIITTTIYSYYVEHLAHYDIVYGSLSNLVIMMMWIYLLSYLFILGIAINVNIYQTEKNVNDNN